MERGEGMKVNGTPHSSGEGKRSAAAARPDPEVSAKAKRRRFTAAYKLSVVEKADACETPGEIGELLRREGLYSSHLSSWRKAAREGSLRGLAKKRGPRPSGGKREARKVRKLERENARLREELRKARIIIDVQGKVAGLLGVSPGDGKRS
jgi:transposase-like protein